MSETQIVVVETENPLVVEINDDTVEVTAPVVEETVIEVMAGARGVTTQWILGAMAPTNEDGSIGDVYLVTQGLNAGDVFKKLVDGTWEPNGSIRGAGYGVTEINGDAGPVVFIDKTTVGLSNVDNTSDADKAISIAAQTALDLKADDDEVVKLTGAQTVAGIKTFSSAPVVPVDSFAISRIIDLQTTLDGKSAVGHGHIIADTTGLQAALDSKEDDIAAGTTAQYYRGDKTWQTLDKTAAGLGNVANLVQVDLVNDQTIAGIKTFSSSPIVPTPTNNTQAANKLYVDTTVNAVIDAAPGALDTLNELAAALGDDPNFATTVTNSIATKVSLTGNESIAGVKTFSSAPLIPDSSFAIVKITGLQAALDLKAPLASPTFTGTITGNGSGLTALNGTQVTTGTVADARLSSNVALLTGTQTFTGAKTFSGGLSASAATLTGILTITPTGNAGIELGRTDNVASQNFIDFHTGTTGANDYDARILVSGGTASVGQANMSIIAGGGITITGAVNIVNSISGPGSGLTSLNGSNISTGTVAIPRLPTEVVYRVLHNGSAWPSRPTGATSVEWVGPVVPTSATANDTWVNSTV